MMRGKSVRIRTGLSAKECAELFEQKASARMRRPGAILGKLAAMAMGNDQSGFFTPTDTPFSALNDDQPDFSVGILIPSSNGGGRGNARALHMYVWDRGDVREVELFSPHGLGGGLWSSRLVDWACAAFHSADPESAIIAG